MPVLRRRTRCRAGASSISPRFRGRTRGEPFGEGDHAVSRPNSRSCARRRALRVADGRGVFSHRAQNTRFGRFPFFAVLPRWRFVSCEPRRALCRAPVSTPRRARVAGGAPARRGVAEHTPPACAFARSPWARMRRTRGSTDRTHSAFASAITATRSRPRERVGFSNDGLVTVSESDSTTPRRRNERLFIDFVFSVFGGARRETASDAFRPRLSLLNRSYVRVLHDRSAAHPTTTSCACATCARCSTRARSRRTSSTARASRFSTRARRRAGKTGKTAPGTSAMKKRR